MSEQSEFRRVGPLAGAIQAEMLAEALKERDIPHYIANDWYAGAFGVRGFNDTVEDVYVFVNVEDLEAVMDISASMFGERDADESTDA